MPNVEANTANKCVILPFNLKNMEDDKLQVTSLAALIAITVMHDANENAEDKLMEIIERSGDVEILDAEDAYADLGLEELDAETRVTTLVPINDNRPFEVV